MDEPYRLKYIVDEMPPVRDVVDRCFEIGLTTTPDGSVKVCQRYSANGTSGASGGDAIPVEQAIEAVSRATTGSIRFWGDGGMYLDVSFSHIDEQPWNVPKLMIEIPTIRIDPTTDVSSETIRSRVETVLQTVGALSNLTEPEYVWGSLRVGTTPDEEFKPTERPIAENIDAISWVTVLSPALIDDLGGRKHVLETPAWRVTELDSGHVSIVRNDNPVDPSEGPSGSVDDHLLGPTGER